jgi:hypothetical protein
VERLLFLDVLPALVLGTRDVIVGLGVPVALLVVSCPVVLALLSRSLLAVLACVLLSASSLILLLSEQSTTACTVALGAAGGSLIVALSSLVVHRRWRALWNEVVLMSGRVKHLEAAEERRLLAGVKLSSPESNAAHPF